MGKAEQRKNLPIEDKESYKWLTSLQAVNEAAQWCPHTHFVSVGDREADVYDLFLLEHRVGVDLLVSAAWNRRTHGEHGEGGRIWADMAAVQESGQTTAVVELPRRAQQSARTATLTVRWRGVRWREVCLRAPKSRPDEKLPSVTLWGVWAREEEPPAGVEPVEWLLMSSCAVKGEEEALERLGWYRCRWGIEVWHKVLKSGCRIEARQLASAARLEGAITVYSVIAWRLMYGTLLARVVPDAPCRALLEQEEWEALYCTIHKVAVPPKEVPTMREAVRWIGQLGGFLGRKGDGEPGVTVMWRGFQRLTDFTTMYQIMRPSYNVINVR